MIEPSSYLAYPRSDQLFLFIVHTNNSNVLSNFTYLQNFLVFSVFCWAIRKKTCLGYGSPSWASGHIYMCYKKTFISSS